MSQTSLPSDHTFIVDIMNPELELKVEEPIIQTYTKLRKSIILLIIAFAGILAPLSSTIYFPSLEIIKNEFNTTDTLVDITISVYLLSLGLMPLIWGGIADRYGRKGVFLISQIIFTLGSVGCGLSNSIEVLIVLRIIQGIGASAPIVTGMGTITDIFQREERGFAMSVFMVGPLVGPIIGPIIGGFLIDAFGWRSTFWTLTILGGVLLIISLFLLPETLAKNVKQSFPIQVNLWPIKVYRGGPFFNPLSPLNFLKFPIVLIACSCIALTFGSFYAVESTMSRKFPGVYNLTASESGLTFIPLGLGSILGNLLGGKISDLSFRKFKKGDINPQPEVRLYGLWAGSFIEAIGLLMTAWFVTYELHLAAPLVAGFLIGSGNTTSIIACSSYLIDNFPDHGSSISACFNAFQMIFTAILTAVNGIILEKLTYGGGLSLYAGLCLIVTVTLIIMYYKGGAIRRRYGPKDQ